jgi:N-acylglucosamine 2-epimerase
MKVNKQSRRNFLKRNTMAGAGMLVLGSLGDNVLANPHENTVAAPSMLTGSIGLNLDALYKRYHSDLFEHFLPNMDKYVIDHEWGGFMCTVDILTGKQLSSNKTAWYEGRGLWTYSFLYNNLGKNPKHLEVARKSKDFILKHRPNGAAFWVSSYDRRGKPLAGPGDIYASLFIAEGLAEYSKAAGEPEYLDEAKKIINSCLARYDSADYSYHVSYLSKSSPLVPAPRVLGHWMIFLRSVTQILEMGADKDMENIADRCVEAILKHHLHPEYNLFNELLNHDLKRPENEYKDFAYMGHGIETLWMLMFEAARRKDSSLFKRTSELFRRHVEVAHDAVYGGYFRSLDHVDNNVWKVDKVLWLQEEILIGTLFIAEHTGDGWAQKCFQDTLEYVHSKFDMSGYKFWASAGDRVLKEKAMNRAEHYHHPRHLMLNLLSLKRIMARKAKPSGLFS